MLYMAPNGVWSDGVLYEDSQVRELPQFIVIYSLDSVSTLLIVVVNIFPGAVSARERIIRWHTGEY